VKNLPDLISLPTTNGDHCTGDGIKIATAIGANTVDMEAIQVHPTGLVHPDEPDSKLKFLAAEALRGVGGILIDANGRRFCDDLGKRDYVTGCMWNNKGPFRLVLNSKAASEIEWHCKHYLGRGLMKQYKSGADLAKEMGIPASQLEEEFKRYNSIAEKNNDPFGKKYFHNLPLVLNDVYHVAIVTPVVHYTMGGLQINGSSEVLGAKGPIPGLYCVGEAMGGVHGKNRLGGNSLLDCVCFGRVAGNSASRYLLSQNLAALKAGTAQGRLATIGGHIAPVAIQMCPDSGRITIDINLSAGKTGTCPATTGTCSTTTTTTATSPAPAAKPAASAPAAPAAAPAPKAPAAAPAEEKTYTLADVSKHTKENDCWVVINGTVLNVTKFLPDHPGGKKAIMLYAGKDASEEFNMLHKPDVVAKYAPFAIIGKLAK
jgi:predicted heme/steroid binding protein